MEKDKLKKALEDSGQVISDPKVLSDWLGMYLSDLIYELQAVHVAKSVIDWLADDDECHRQANGKEQIREAVNMLVRVAEMRHNARAGDAAHRDYGKLLEQTAEDFFGGVHLSSVVCIMDTLSRLMEDDRCRRG